MKVVLCIFVVGLIIFELVLGHGDHHHGPPDIAHHFDTTKCCKVESSEAQAQFIDGLIKFVDECIKEQGLPEEGKPSKLICFAQCLGNNIHIIGADGNLDEATYRTFVTSMATESYQKTMIDATVTKCIEKIKTPDSSEEKGPDGCSKTSIRAFQCAKVEMLKACPADMQDTSDGCKKFREIVESGKRPH